MFYKLKIGDMIVDAINNPIYIQVLPNNEVIQARAPSRAFGVISSDMTTNYAVVGMKPAPEGYQQVEMVAIDEIEYNNLKEQLKDSAGIDEEENHQEQQETEKVLSNAELYRMVQELSERNAMLEDCILEMSEYVYA